MERNDAKYLPLAAVGALAGFARYYVRPELTANRAWKTLALGIAAYELACPDGELMSEGADRLIEKSPLLGRAAILMAGLIITGHVANTFGKYDPIHGGLKTLKGL